MEPLLRLQKENVSKKGISDSKGYKDKNPRVPRRTKTVPRGTFMLRLNTLYLFLGKECSLVVIKLSEQDITLKSVF